MHAHPSSRRRPGLSPLSVGSAVLLAVLLLAGRGIPVGGGWPAAAAPLIPAQTPPLAKGVFLIASPHLGDPNFRETVVLLWEYGPEGTLGLVVNRPSPVLLEEALPSIPMLKGTKHRLYLGGPVQPNGVLLLFRVKEPPPGAKPVMDGVYLGDKVEFMEELLAKARPGEAFRVYAGYAGWAPGQLESEMAMGAWATLQADPASIFEHDPGGLWEDLLRALAAPRVIRAGLKSSTVREAP